MAERISFDCASMSIAGHFYCIELDGNEVRCDCGGYALRWCSHIEATLVHGERAMVRPEHRERVEIIRNAAAELRFAAPPEWKSAWRKLLKWRGLGSGRVFVPSTVGQSGRPVVCFTGAMPRPRKELAAEAEAAGWEVIDRPHRHDGCACRYGSRRRLRQAPVRTPERRPDCVTRRLAGRDDEWGPA